MNIRFLIVAMFFIFIVFLFMVWLFGPYYSVPDEPPKKWSLDEPEIMYRSIGADHFLDVTASVKGVEPEGDPGLWPETRITIVHANGTVILYDWRLQPNDPSEYDNGTYRDVYIEAWYISRDNSARVKPGDSIKITGLTEQHEAARVKVHVAEYLVAEFSIPPPPIG